MYNLLKKLCDSISPSGYEDDVRSIVIEELRDAADKLWVDSMGNVIAVKKGSGDGKLMLAAHMDEIGLFISHIDEHGFLRAVPIGGIPSRALLYQRVLIKTRKGNVVRGVIGLKPPHILKKEELEKIPEINELFIDIGVSSKEEAETLGVSIGDVAVLDRELTLLANNRVTGKAIDDRSGLTALIASFKLLEQSDVNLYAVATVQEEVGLKGAHTSAYAISPDAALALDVTIASDVPDTPQHQWFTVLGKGPAIKVVDGRSASGLIANKGIVDKLIEIASTMNIPYQLEVAAGGTTDASVIALNKEGVPAGVVSVPARYIHSPVEVIDLNDLAHTVVLVRSFIEKIDSSWVKSLKGKVVK